MTPSPAGAVELLYKKEEPLQGKIFARERAEKVDELAQTFVRARKIASDLEAGLEFARDDDARAANRVRAAFRQPPFKDFRKNGREILTLIGAQEEALPNTKPAVTLR